MIVGGFNSILRAAIALPAAGAEATCASMRVIDLISVALRFDYTLQGGSVIGAPTIFPAWTFRGSATVYQGFMLSGGTLVREAYPLVTGTFSRIVELFVPPGAVLLVLNVSETGDAANPGLCGVAGNPGI